MLREKLGRRRELKIFVSVMFPAGEAKVLVTMGGLAKERFEKLRAFEPPVAKELRVERRYDDRIEVERAQLVELLPARAQEMRGMRLRDLSCDCRVVELLLDLPACDPVIFYAGKFSQSRIRSRPEMFER